MFGSRCSLSAAVSNCSFATSHGSRWVWSMVAADLMRRLSFCRSFQLWRIELVDGQPRGRCLARRVWAVPVLEDDTLEAEARQCLAPRAQPAGHVRCEPDVHARRDESLEMAL